MDGEWYPLPRYDNTISGIIILYPLPSGRLVCHNTGVKYHADARADCNKVGGYLAEITSR